MKLSRKGHCTHGNCALICCKACPWLVKRGVLYYCKDYENAPLGCREFPIDEIELNKMNKAIRKEGYAPCGHYWQKSKVVKNDSKKPKNNKPKNN